MGPHPVISRFAMLRRWKGEKLKERLFLDVKQSRVPGHTRQSYRTVLRRVTDAIWDALVTAANAGDWELFEWFVMDF